MNQKERFPEDTYHTIYVRNCGTLTMGDLIAKAREKWGLFDINDLLFDHEEIQVSCFGYDQYDPIDYVFYFTITLKQ